MSLQSLIAGLIVASCLGYLLRMVWRTLRARSRGACGGCSSCDHAAPPPREAPITLHRRPR